MGLFNRSGDSDEGTRRYKITYFGENIGAFKLPEGEHMENPEALLRKILTKPYKEDWGDSFALFWAEENVEGGFFTVRWEPETGTDRAEAERFYQAAHGLAADGSVDPAKQPPLPTRSTEETRLIRAILANRSDDQPYLDYADWLAGKSDPYGQVLQLSRQLEPLAEDDEHRERLELRREELFEKYGPNWVRTLTELGLFPGDEDEEEDGFDPSEWFNDKGVIEEIDVPAGTFVFRKNPARLFHGAPLLRRLSIEDSTVTVAHIAAILQMAQIESLDISDARGTDADFERFVNSPNFGSLRELTLTEFEFSPALVTMLTSARWFPSLHMLDIGANDMGDAGAEAFAASPQIANLNSLYVSGNDIRDHGLLALCASPHFSKLKEFYALNNSFTAEGMHGFQTAAFASTLEVLDLSGCGLDGEALAVLAACSFPMLKLLGVSQCPYSDDAVAQLVAAPSFKSLELFAATGGYVSSAFARAFASLGFTPLTELDLRTNQLDDAAVEAIVRSKAAKKLVYLYLGHNPFGVDGVRAIVETDLPDLEELDLTGIKLGREGATLLANARGFKKLEYLDLSEDSVGPRARDILIERFGEDTVSFEG